MSAYPRPILCAKCEVDLYPEKNGVYLIELFQHDENFETYLKIAKEKKHYFAYSYKGGKK